MQHAIGEHALLADGRTAALVDPDGNIAWLCWPRINVAPCLLSILDDVVGGCFRVAPSDPAAVVVARDYVPGTLILRTVWRVGGDELTVFDALACDGEPRLLRSMSARGRVEVAVTLAMAPDAALAGASVATHGDVLRVTGGGLDIAVHAPGPWSADDAGVATCLIRVGSEAAAVVFCDGGAVPGASLVGTRQWFAARVPAAAALRPNSLAAATLGESTAQELMRRSAVVLAALHQRGGGIVAAPTTSLPQWPGGRVPGTTATAGCATQPWPAWACCASGSSPTPRPRGFPGSRHRRPATGGAAARRRHGAAGGTHPAHLRGHRGGRPVRIGNGASAQPQLDVAGEVLEFAAALAARDLCPPPSPPGRPGSPTGPPTIGRVPTTASGRSAAARAVTPTRVWPPGRA